MKISFKRFFPQRHVSAGTLRNSFDRRSIVLGTMQGGIGVLLATRLGYLAVAQNAKYELEAESNRVNLSLIPPRRGWILDRAGTPLASNRADFRVDLIPERLQDIPHTIQTLGKLLNLSPIALQDLEDKLDKARGFAPVEVASGLDWERFAAVSVRLPDLPGVVTQRGFSRFYPLGPSVGHLIGYVGPASAEEYEKDHDPVLITPGYKVGKDALEKFYEKDLRGKPGARRVEVTASGRIVRDLDTREDVPGKTLKLTIDAGIQEYASRRIGPESAAVVVMDCQTGDILAMCSMPSFDPNSFSDGIGRLEWKMLSDDDHVPLRNKVLRGLYPPGSTVKPMVALSFMEAGLDPKESVFCGGGLRVGNRVFHCWNRRGHGQVNMAKGIYQSCDVYFYHFAQRMGMDPIAAMASRLGLGHDFPLPVSGQSYGTVPNPAWKLKKYGKEWQTFDTVNATIGQGYFLVNPLQQAIQAARIATGRVIMPRLVHGHEHEVAPSLGIPDDHLAYVRQAMSDVANGPGSARHAALPFPDIKLAGKTGTAQVVGLNIGNGKGGLWKHRDHGHFICFAPVDNPRYACSVVVEHGGGSGAAYPIARDVLTYVFDKQKGMDILTELEKKWGGTPTERLDARYRTYSAQYGVGAPAVSAEEENRKLQGAESGQDPAQPIVNEAQAPAPEPGSNDPPPAAPPASAPSPATTTAPQTGPGGTQ
ncbi:penicillin-binding protein 2 [Novosphingobium aerophilum]|uniref:penicillin-binding protein 2 n=1 Tax=Novosphingobium TaxID=165696 RepID=UPI0006C8DA63|nr:MULTISPECIES: penicillin-binding protein 2 [unclassified Novosphingobium]KPH66541.1 penicillin-binding protein [Novosphingobium sp. ST904]MPS69207.1 penicillin-binding protein 2 [Novosphingobium sp.]TCM42349.1 penicillin-binding protein 2 [Novosphingobium sp. ST904]WRT91611.1 penicillin-binding protein 2 [Novosphingobium sp. RL4]